MKSLIGLWKAMAEDLSALDGVSTNRDLKTVTDRTNTEGLSFLTITLPDFESDFVNCLEVGAIGSGHFLGFKRKGGLPAFLWGFLCRVFDPRSGKILDEPCVNSVLAIRQLTCLFKKIELDCHPKRVKAAFTRYIECENELKQCEREWTSYDYAEFSRISSLLFGDVFDQVNREIDSFTLVPRHGPGSTADRLVGNQKWRFTEWTERLEEFFPFQEYAGPNYDPALLKSTVHLPASSERPVKVITVLKTAKRPRIIAMEPTCMQFLQQAVAPALTQRLEKRASYSIRNASRAHSFDSTSRLLDKEKFSILGFRDQLPNQLLAQKGSVDGSLATLDLSEASDRVSNQLVFELFRPWPSLSGAVQASRSRSAVLPDGTKVRLGKFASMGSALCFPIEAIVFATIVHLGIQDALKTRLSPRDLVRLRGKVRVYGDDIIVPVEYATAVMEKLEHFGLKVNTTKSFWKGNFRESCGGDFFRGEWVTPLRLGKSLPSSRQDVAGIQNWVEFSNSLHMSGFWKSAEFVAAEMRKLLGPLPVTDVETSALSLKSFTPGTRGEVGWDDELQRPKLKAWMAQVVVPRNEIDGYAALRKSLVKRPKALLGERDGWHETVFPAQVDPDHLLRSGRPSSVHLKKRWSSI